MPDAVTHYFRYTTDDVSDTSPSWVDASDLVRGFDVNRGRANELSRVDPGTARILLDNRGRDFDPVANPLIRPMNRWWLQVVHPGGTDDLFFGYAESYQQEWPGAGGRDAVCVVHLVDEFKVLALDALPTSDPPRDTYRQVVMFDSPQGYWPLTAPNIFEPVLGDRIEMFSSATGYGYSLLEGPILGDAEAKGYGIVVSTWGYIIDHDSGAAGDAGGESEFTAEGWFMHITSIPSGPQILFAGPFTTDATYSWKIGANSSGQFTANAKNSSGTDHALTGTTIATPDTEWYHVVATIDGGLFRLYVNGVQEASTAWTGTFEAQDISSTPTWIGNGTNATAGQLAVDELAFFRFGLTAERILAHYQAGAERGFEYNQLPGARIEDILDAADNQAARAVRTGTREMVSTKMTGQSPLEEIRRAELAENVDAVFFIAKDGTVTFLDDGHRAVSPWDTVQATFDDDGTDLPYLGVTVDYSESFLYNVVEVARQGGTLVTDQDADSIAEHFRRPLPIGELPITTDADVTSAAESLVAKYKDPMIRITGLSLTTGHDGIAAAVFPLEIGDRIRVQRTPPNAEDVLYPSTSLYPSTTLYPTSGRIDQTLFIQKIQVTGNAQSPYWNITLGVSPL